MTKITKTMFKKALEGSLGTQRDLSERLNVSDSAISQYLERNPDMKALLSKQRLTNIDLAEHEIFLQLDFQDYNKEPASAAKIRQGASTYILNRLGRDKGWVEKTEIEHSGERERFILIEKSVEEIKDGKSNDKSETEGNS